MMITQELPLMLMHMDGCTLESVLAFRRFVSDSSIRGVWQGWHHQINSSIIIVIITTPYCFYHYNYYRYNHCYYGQSSAPHVRCQKRNPIYDVIPSTDLYTTPEYITLYYSYSL